MLPKLNEHVHRVTESGLLYKWQREAETFNENVLIRQAKMLMTEPKPLQLHHVQSAFVLLLVGCAGAFIAFAFEWINFLLIKYKRTKAFILIERFFLEP